MSTENKEEQIVLACEIPETASPGSTFHVQLEDRYFEVLTPEGALPGQTIHIVVPTETSIPSFKGPDVIMVPDLDPSQYGQLSVFEQLRILGDRAVTHAKTLDTTYQITNKIGEIAQPAVDKLKVVDEKYKISETTVAAGAQAKAKIQELDEKYEVSSRTSAFISSTVQKVREIDETHSLTQRAATAGENLLAYAKEIDARYAVSANAARIVQVGTNSIIAAYNKAVEIDQHHHLTERAAAAISAGATVLAHQVSKLSGSGVTTVEFNPDASIPAPALDAEESTAAAVDAAAAAADPDDESRTL